MALRQHRILTEIGVRSGPEKDLVKEMELIHAKE